MDTEIKVGNTVEAVVTRITDFGAFVKINAQAAGLIHISQISDSFVKDINEHLKIGDKVKARVIKLGPGNKIDLSLKEERKDPRPEYAPGAAGRAKAYSPLRAKPLGTGAQRNNNFGFKSSDFEEKLRKFLQASNRTLADLKKHSEKYHK